QSDLTNIGNFGNRIVNGFGKHDSNPGDSVILKKLATHLHKFLFFNPELNSPYHGTQLPIRMPTLDYLDEDEEYADLDSDIATNIEPAEQEPESIDPFEMRAKTEIEQKISQALLRFPGSASRDS
ncbi:hypothetical protein GGI23_004817, partial [Coemansia sp. RSA 2559]